MSPNPAPPPAALVFVFDDRLGTRERDEHAKLLGVFPSTTSSDDCCAAVGLAQGVTAFLAPFVDEISVAELQSVAEGKGGTTGTKQNTKPHAKHPKQTQARSACLTGSSRRLVCYEPEPHVRVSPITTFRLPDCPYSYQKGRLPSECLSIHRDILVLQRDVFPLP